MVGRAAILRWTGRGSASDLQSSVEHILRARGIRARTKAVGGSIVVGGPEPVGVCSVFENLPGTSWTAAGYSVGSAGDLTEASRVLAANYLKRGSRFSVQAEDTGGGVPSDLAGAVTSAMLDRVKGARARVGPPGVRFRVAFDGGEGVLGVEIGRGPGGTPTGSGAADCLVSGGMHSSVLAWSAVLVGFRVNLVHAATGEGGLYAAARLYSELSNRADPRGVSLTVLEGGSPGWLLSGYAARSKRPLFGGFTVGRPPPAALRRRVQSPLYLMPEEAFASQFHSLRLRGHRGTTDWRDSRSGSYAAKSFGGKIADVSGVLDGLS